MINWDLTGCCPSGLNFIPPDSMIYPYDFPEAGAFVTMTGTMKEAFNGKSNELYFFYGRLFVILCLMTHLQQFP